MAQRKSRSAGLAKAIAAAGSITALAAKIKLTVQAVSQWTDVPADRCLVVERATGVPRYELRPDIYGKPPKEAASIRRPKTSVQRSAEAA